MIDLNEMQKRIFKNKVDKGFNTTDVFKEFCYVYGEMSEACDAYLKKKNDIGEELADVTIFVLGLSEMLGINLENEIYNKVVKNEKRQYIRQNGVDVRLNE